MFLEICKNSIIIMFSFILVTISCSKKSKREVGGNIEKASKTYTNPSDTIGTVNVMTYNVEWDKETTGDYQWTYRRNGVVNLIERHNPDIIGIQEAFINQLKYISIKLKKYKYFGYGTDDGKAEYDNPDRAEAMNPIMYDSTRFTLLERGVFWYSNDPDHPNLGFSVSHFRNCVWGKFRETFGGRQGRIIYVFNTHFALEDNVRIKQAALLKSKVMDIAGKDSLTLVIGDFNSDPIKTQSYKALTEFLTDTRNICTGTVAGPNFTGSGIVVNSRSSGLMADHIFVRNISRCSFFQVIDDYEGEKYPSDHFAVLSIISY